MRKIIINVICFTAVCYIVPFSIHTWEYWVILGCLLAVQVNNSID